MTFMIRKVNILKALYDFTNKFFCFELNANKKDNFYVIFNRTC